MSNKVKALLGGLVASLGVGIAGLTVYVSSEVIEGQTDEAGSRAMLQERGFDVGAYKGTQSGLLECRGYRLRDGFAVTDKNTNKQVLAIVCKDGSLLGKKADQKDKIVVRNEI